MSKMPRGLRARLTYANVMSTIAMLLALSGGVAFAATKLSANSVTSRAIKKGAVTSRKIANNAVTGSKIAANAVNTSKIAANAVNTSKIAANAVNTSKIADNAVTTGKLAPGAITGAKVAADTLTGGNIDEGSLHFGCNAGTATPLLGGPCTARLTSSGATWQDAVNACRTLDGGATLPTPAQIAAYAPLGGVPWKSGIFWTSDLAGTGPPPSGAWEGQTDANGNLTLFISTALSDTTTTNIACVYDAATAPRPGS